MVLPALRLYHQMCTAIYCLLICNYHFQFLFNQPIFVGTPDFGARPLMRQLLVFLPLFLSQAGCHSCNSATSQYKGSMTQKLSTAVNQRSFLLALVHCALVPVNP